MPAAIALFSRDLRLDDNPALVGAAEAGPVVPLFVLDDELLAGPYNRPNRTGFLLESLADLDASLQGIGSRLVLRRGAWVDEVLAVANETAATRIFVADDVSGFARTRLRRLEGAAADADVSVTRTPGVTVVPPDELRTGGGGPYQVFTPYHRRWLDAAWRAPRAAPTSLALPSGIRVGRRPGLAALVDGERSPRCSPGGETAGRERVEAFLDDDLAAYGDDRRTIPGHDDLAGDGTSRLSPYLHFGCISPLALASRLAARKAAAPFVRQLSWRDFYHQLLADRPDAAWTDYRDAGDIWLEDDDGLAAWRDGRTGYPLVDAGMRQLREEGWMHNRARMVTASFLTKDLGIDWRVGARHFLDLLLDGDVANNNLNWQWTAGTGTDTNPHRVLSPIRQGERFDPAGEYVRRYVPELADVDTTLVHTPWELGPLERSVLDYPDPIVDHREAIEEWRARRANA